MLSEIHQFNKAMDQLEEESVALDNLFAIHSFAQKYGYDERIAELVGQENFFTSIKNIAVRVWNFIVKTFRSIVAWIGKLIKWVRTKLSSLFKKKLPKLQDRKMPPNANTGENKPPIKPGSENTKPVSQDEYINPKIVGLVNLPFNLKNTKTLRPHRIDLKISLLQLARIKDLSADYDDDVDADKDFMDQINDEINKYEVNLKSDPNAWYQFEPSFAEPAYKALAADCDQMQRFLDTQQSSLEKYTRIINSIGTVSENPPTDTMKKIVNTIMDVWGEWYKFRMAHYHPQIARQAIKDEKEFPEIFKNDEPHSFDTHQEIDGEQTDPVKFKKFLKYVKDKMDNMRVRATQLSKSATLLLYETQTVYNAVVAAADVKMTEFYHETFPLPSGLNEQLKYHFDKTHFWNHVVPKLAELRDVAEAYGRETDPAKKAAIEQRGKQIIAREFNKYCQSTSYNCRGILIGTEHNQDDGQASLYNEGHGETQAAAGQMIVLMAVNTVREALKTNFDTFAKLNEKLKTIGRHIAFDIESNLHGFCRVLLHELRHLYDSQNDTLVHYTNKRMPHPQSDPNTGTYGRLLKEFEADRSAIEASKDKQVINLLFKLVDTIKDDFKKKGLI